VDKPLHVDENSFRKIAAAAPVPVLVAFVDDRLRSCRVSAPDMYEAARQFAGRLIVLMIDVNACPELSIHFDVRTVPHFLLLNGSHVVLTHSGAVQKADLERWITPIAPDTLADTKLQTSGTGLVTRLFDRVLQLFATRPANRRNARSSVVRAA